MAKATVTTSLSFPRLVELYGRRYALAQLLDPGHNINERSHAVVGTCLRQSRENYFKRWKRSLEQRVKPVRDTDLSMNTRSDLNDLDDLRTFGGEMGRHRAGMNAREPGSSMASPEFRQTPVYPAASSMDPKSCALRQKVATTLSKISLPQLNEFFKVGDIVGAGREGTVRPGFPIPVDKVSMVRNPGLAEIADRMNSEHNVNGLHSADSRFGSILRTQDFIPGSSLDNSILALQKKTSLGHFLKPMFDRSEQNNLVQPAATNPLGVRKSSIAVDTAGIVSQKKAELASKFQGKLAAIKSVQKQESQSKDAYREVQVLKALSEHRHPNISPYIFTFESPIRLHILTEFCKGGDLFSYMQDHDFARQNENDVARVMIKLLTGILDCHESGYVHLDLKLENIMRKEQGPQVDSGDVVIIDFGHAARMPQSKSDGIDNHIGRLVRPVGSPSYAAPEVVLRKEYSSKSDTWGLGVIMYILLQGYLPFPHLQRKKWREFTINDYGNFDGKHQDNDPFSYEGDWEDISPLAKDCCQKMLDVNIHTRPDISEVISHPWFKAMGYRMQRNEHGTPLPKSDDRNHANNNVYQDLLPEKQTSWL